MATSEQTDRDQAASDDNLQVAYPEVFPGATPWAYSHASMNRVPNVTVTQEGLKRLLRMVADMQPFMMVAVAPEQCDDMYADETTRENAIKLLNETGRVWCEGDLIVSGLFVDDAGEPIINECAEENDQPDVHPEGSNDVE